MTKLSNFLQDADFHFWGNPLLQMRAFNPTCDVDETDSYYLISFDLPGVKKEDIKIEMQDGRLMISGERFETRENKTRDRHDSRGSNNPLMNERSFGVFRRVFSLPGGVMAEQIETEYTDGVLRIAVPKTAASKTQSIKIGESKLGFWDKLMGHRKEENSPASLTSSSKKTPDASENVA